MIPGEVDQACLALAAGQDGVVTRAQLLALALPRGAIEHRLEIGRYVPLYRGVYAIGGVPIGGRARARAALLAGGPDAALSHRWAGAELRMRPATGPPEITVPGPRRRSRPDLVIHTEPPFSPGDVILHRGLRVTSPVRTLLDLAAVEPLEALDRALTEALVLALVTPTQLIRALDALPRRRRGATALRGLLDDTAPTRSELERAMRRLIDDAGLPQPVVNTRIAGHEADLAWARQRLIVEVDGWRAHGNRAAFERDRARDLDHQAAGWTVVRLSWRQVMDRPLLVAARLGRLLAQAPE